MATELFYTALDVPGTDGLAELDDVILRTGIDAGASGWIPEGTEGTIVSVHGFGEAYTIEFGEPHPALILIAAEKVMPVSGATRDLPTR